MILNMIGLNHFRLSESPDDIRGMSVELSVMDDPVADHTEAQKEQWRAWYEEQLFKKREAIEQAKLVDQMCRQTLALRKIAPQIVNARNRAERRAAAAQNRRSS